MAVATDYHKLGGVRQNITVSQCWSLEVQNQSVSKDCASSGCSREEPVPGWWLSAFLCCGHVTPSSPSVVTFPPLLSPHVLLVRTLIVRFRAHQDNAG